jgi:hypothetical protein
MDFLLSKICTVSQTASWTGDQGDSAATDPGAISAVANARHRQSMYGAAVFRGIQVSSDEALAAHVLFFDVLGLFALAITNKTWGPMFINEMEIREHARRRSFDFA